MFVTIISSTSARSSGSRATNPIPVRSVDQ